VGCSRVAWGLVAPLLTLACSSGGGSSPDASIPVIVLPPPPLALDGGAAAIDGTAAPPHDAAASTHDGGAALDAGGATQPPGTLQPGTSTLTIITAGMTRSVYLHVPQAVLAGPIPLVLALHGDGDTDTNFVATVGLTTDSDAEGFVLAAPQGITRDVPVYEGGQVAETVPQVDWDPYNSISSSGAIVSDENNDVPLLDAIRTQLVATGSIDMKRIVVYGYSQGGYMSFRYGMSTAAVVACEAVIAAAHPLPGTMLVEAAARKIPVYLQIGTLDSPYSNAESTATELMTNGNPYVLNAVSGAGHVPVPGDPTGPLDWCLQHPLP
jgi:predicted esterase